ncbi:MULTISPECIES: hypothetical protein [unclassified Microcystis]|jgi:hypothetical protein|uniref:Uncharacterized protein n=1 Tax=Microcystis flos-aquae Mf_QC_C_20070823_S10D TaxID=2486236 RepID=A0A552KGL5_9CHRO|nr:hypothetical protein [Microcystis sp. M091S2]MCA2644408.1 hypothetical protein [Microcystis sp. M069S2]MCA2663527.1 hypothetical protein [Microcystis sp. M064S2]MCA2674529.1 hypothetical protein [Microcystis sp. M054S2]MCA2769733.1 hypothetical protein [Microcystis sp. M122S2]MCA2789483.1 hypothetical protein [Microcystis sp. M116S2]MCA2798190.1 hypothetical protein [Microcystis sp. M100S2]MCA2819400.1 hypothetical protein [Microcystis sp. M085S1]MCA2823054.1 hypothetical protein [Microc
MIDRSLCPLCLCGSFHSLPQDCILEYILPTKPGRAERVFVGLEASSDVDDELALLKAQMLLGNTAHPPTLKDSAVDAELEELRSKLKEL